jgi:hypothetical protein
MKDVNPAKLSKSFQEKKTTSPSMGNRVSISAIRAAVDTTFTRASTDAEHLHKPVEEALLAGLNVMVGAGRSKTVFSYQRDFAGDIFDEGKNPPLIQKVPYSITTSAGDVIMTMAISDPGAGPSLEQPNKWQESLRYEPGTGKKAIEIDNPRVIDILAIVEAAAQQAHAKGQIVLEGEPTNARRLTHPQSVFSGILKPRH